MSKTPRTDDAWESAQDVGEEVAWRLCRELERENTALRADKERLDWLEIKGASLDYHSRWKDWGETWWTCAKSGENWAERFCYKTAREAIDGAIGKEMQP